MEHDPPFYVMRYYQDGDLTTRYSELESNLALQEQVFINAIDCVNELHQKNIYHRDIKPQNFLQDGGKVVVSDMGLSVGREFAETTLTSTAESWGTFGYLPPESFMDGFKDCDSSYDVYMLGKTFYNLLTRRQPAYLAELGIPNGIYHVITRACSHDKTLRYQNLFELKQAIVGAYDILLNRVDGVMTCRSVWESIKSTLTTSNNYSVETVTNLIDRINVLDVVSLDLICQNLDSMFFQIISQSPFDSVRSAFLNSYRKMVEKQNYAWSFAETIAQCMAFIFYAPSVQIREKADALDLAIFAASSQNRYAAMDTCIAMITSVVDNNLANAVSTVMLKYPKTFVVDIEPANCPNDILYRTLQQMKQTTQL